MTDRDDAIEAVRQEYAAKFDELCGFLAAQYGLDLASLSDERRAEIVAEGEELARNWNEAATIPPALRCRPTEYGPVVPRLTGDELRHAMNWHLEAKTQLQRLLAEYYEIGEFLVSLEDEKRQEDDD
jgi:hypothetical protein